MEHDLTKAASSLHIRILKDELERRKGANKRYSLRAFARALDMDASALSRILSGKQEASLSLCLKVVKKLKLDEDLRVRFISSVAEEKRRRTTESLSRALDNPSVFASASVLSLLVDPIFVVDLEGNFLFVNEVGIKVIGLFPDQMIGLSKKQLNVEGSKIFEEIERQNSKVIATRKRECFEVLVPLQSGSIWYERIVTPLLDKEGGVRALLVAWRIP